MNLYINLDRRFWSLSSNELDDPDTLISLSEHSLGGSRSWSELLANRRIVLLAEAGSGKTREMQEQAKQLRMQKKFAFFLPLEGVHREGLETLLSNAEEMELAAWKASSDRAWFFLDAVDELKLTEGKLERALQRLAKAIDGYTLRAHIIVSCRPHDWRPSFDMVTFRNLLPLPAEADEEIVDSEEVFLAPLQGANDQTQLSKAKQAPEEFKTVVLLPLAARQISAFAKQYGVSSPETFCSELDRRDAWIFARRPFDLIELLQTWSSEGKLGTRAEQHAANIKHRLKDVSDRPDRGVLSDEKAREGAERLALALALTRTRTIRSPDQASPGNPIEGALDPDAVLADWTPAERATLLRRGLFDPATYGRVRFHHRSVQEFLAARRLANLRKAGVPAQSVFRLLFAERYGMQVVLPSMRAIGAWLSLWDDDVRRELTNREPETLLIYGDPESLTIADRANLLKTFATMYGSGGRRGLNIPLSEVRRLSHPNLASTVRSLWGEGGGPANHDVRELLIEMIWKGPIAECADLVARAALNAAWDEYHRVAAIRALVACERTDLLRIVANSMLADKKDWPARVVFGAAADLFPNTLSVKELVTLIRRTPEPRASLSGFGNAFREIAESLDPTSSFAIKLRTDIAKLIVAGSKGKQQQYYHLHSKYDYLSRGLATLCERQLDIPDYVRDTGLIDACVIAFRFQDHSRSGDVPRSLQAKFAGSGASRSYAFWSDLRLMDEIAPTKDDLHRAFQTVNNGLLNHLTDADKYWLEAALKDTAHSDRRGVALHMLIDFWHRDGKSPTDLANLQSSVQGDSDLEATLNERTADTGQSKAYEDEQRRVHQRKLKREQEEKARLRKWIEWRDSLIADPKSSFLGRDGEAAIADLYNWLDRNPHEAARLNVWNKELVTRVFSPEVAAAAEEAFIAYWRKVQPMLWSRRPIEERSSTRWGWLYGLCGLAAESATPNWTNQLTTKDAQLAATYATIELNELAPFIGSLAEAFPEEVEATLGDELSAQLNMVGIEAHLPMLQTLAHADHSIKALMKPRLLAALPKWPKRVAPDSSDRCAHHLKQVLRLLLEVCNKSENAMVADTCASRYQRGVSGPLALVWLKALFDRDPERAAEILAAALIKGTSEKQKKYAIRAFAVLFDDRNAAILKFADSDLRARILAKLVRSAYAYIRPDDDNEHDGVYSPDIRDRAEQARSFLLSALLDTQGHAAQQELLELARDPLFSHLPDRLKLLARQRAAADAEFEPYTPEAIAALEKHQELPPHDRDGMFELMMDRLRGLQHDFTHHDFSDRRTIRGIKDEVEMQRTLAMRLHLKANGSYSITREDEVADRKETDIRFHSRYGGQKAVAELKIADDRWSVADLEWALENQLLSQYLRHDDCRAGCLLLTFHNEEKKWLHPTTKAPMTFPEVVEHLSEQARELEAKNRHGVRLAVFGLDLTDPVLPQAHRGKR